MKKVGVAIIGLLLFIGILSEQTVQAKSWPSGPNGVSAEGAIVMDAKSGMILYEKNIHEEFYPASITKILTTLVALENSSLTENVTYSSSAVLGLEQGASNAGIQVGERMSMEQSLYCVMLPSANEACNGVAEHIAGSVKNFSKMMNAKAKSLGCQNTHFTNPNGLWQKNHYTSPYDMALIMRAAMKNDMFRTIASTTRYEIAKNNKRKKATPIVCHHQMLFPINQPQYGYDYAVAGKTGYTSKSQATLVTFAKKDDMELVCVVMKTRSGVQGEPNIYTDTIKLFNYCFERFSQYSVSDSTASQISDAYMFTKFSPFFDAEKSAITLDGEGSVLLPRNVALDKAEKKVQYYETPVETDEGKVIGRVSYFYEGKEAGGSDIIFHESEAAAVLTDSIDMNKWVQDAVEEASTPAFPWKNLLILLLISAVTAAIIAFIVMKVRDRHAKQRVRKHYKRMSKNKNSIPEFFRKDK